MDFKLKASQTLTSAAMGMPEIAPAGLFTKLARTV